MRQTEIFLVHHEHGTDLFGSYRSLVDYCRDWWHDISEYIGNRSHEHMLDDDIIKYYFLGWEKKGNGGLCLPEWYESYILLEDQIEWKEIGDLET